MASAGLFVLDPAGGVNNLRFPHKQYFEYLVAKIAWLTLAAPDNEVVKAITRPSRPWGLGMPKQTGHWDTSIVY